MDLGTMGIPREVAQLNQANNFLYTSAIALGPGEYETSLDPILKKSPSAGFGKLAGNNKHAQAQWEEKMEKYIGVKPSERKPPPKRDNAVSNMQTFENQMQNKPSFMFQSNTQK